MVRLTADKLKKVLEANEGVSVESYFSGNNVSQSRIYTIRDGNMYVKSSGKTSWSDSRYSDDEELCTPEQTRRILHKHPVKFHLADFE